MSDRIDRLSQLNEWLDSGRIDQSEYEALKRELFSGEESEGEAEAYRTIAAAIHRDVVKLQDRTYAELGVTRKELEEVDRAGFNILQGTEVFTKGVEAHTRMILDADRDMRTYVEKNPGYHLIPIYVGIVQTIEVMLAKSEGVGLPLEVRGFMASYAMLAWEWLAEAGISYEPGGAATPAELFESLGVDAATLASDGPRGSDGLLAGGFLPDDAPHELYVKAWEAIPFHGFLGGWCLSRAGCSRFGSVWSIITWL